VVAQWTSAQRVTGMNLDKDKAFSFFHAAIMLFYNIILYFPKIFNYTSLYGPIASGASVDPTSQV
jgi:hypothetical protein